MKNVRLIFGMMLVSIVLIHNLSAGPVYTVKLTRQTPTGEQTVVGYGDQHDTPIIDENRERRYIDAFCRELEKIDTETLFLYEDLKFSPMDSIFSKQDQMICSHELNRGFMFATRSLADAISKRQKCTLQVQSIDPRIEYSLIEISLLLHQVLRKNNFSLSRSKAVVWNKGYEAIKNAKISDVFVRFITNVELFAEFAHDERAAKIFNDIAKTMKARKKLLWKKIIADTGLSKNELNQATVETVAMEMATDRRYAKLADFLLNSELTAAEYAVEAVEAEALWRIVEVPNPCQKIVVIAGFLHVRNLEKYLCELGFEKSVSAGQEYIRAFETCIEAQASWDSILNPSHAERVSTLFPGDSFWQSLFLEDINAAEQAMIREETVLTEEQYQVYQVYSDMLEKKQALSSFDPIPLVPLETFKWINEADQSSKKRPREDDLEELHVTKKSRK